MCRSSFCIDVLYFLGGPVHYMYIFFTFWYTFTTCKFFFGLRSVAQFPGIKIQDVNLPLKQQQRALQILTHKVHTHTLFSLSITSLIPRFLLTETFNTLSLIED
jgi:hypothetical protein